MDRRLERSRRVTEQKRQRLAIILGMGVIAIVAGIIAYGYYDNFVVPPGRLAAQVGDTKYSQGDLVKRIRLIRDTTGSIDLSTAPIEVLFNMVEAELIKQGSRFEGVSITDEDVDLALRSAARLPGRAQPFYPVVPEGQEVDEGQLEAEFKENYRSFLTLAGVSDQEYRVLVEDVLYRTALHQKLGEQIPEKVDHVEVNWIRLPVSTQPVDPNNPEPSPDKIRDRLETEEFSAVAQSVTVDPVLDRDRDGYVGWIAKGSYSDLDKILFGSVDEEPIAHSEISDVIFTNEASYIVQVIGGPEERVIDVQARERLKDETLAQWIEDQRAVGIDQGWLEVNFDSSLYQWVIDELRRSPERNPTGES